MCIRSCASQMPLRNVSRFPHQFLRSKFFQLWMQFLRFVCYNSSWIPLCLIRFLLTVQSQQSYFTLRYLFINHFSWNSLYLNYTGSSYLELMLMDIILYLLRLIIVSYTESNTFPIDCDPAWYNIRIYNTVKFCFLYPLHFPQKCRGY